MQVISGKCRCGNTAGKKISPKTKQKVCKRCYRKDLWNKPKKKKKKKTPIQKKKVYPVKREPSKRLLPTYKGFEGTKAQEFCDTLRKNQTGAERRFGFLLGLLGIPIAAQYPVKREDCDSFYILDFYLPTLNLIVEIDGEYHEADEMREKDSIRDEFLKTKGFKVIRLTNRQVYNTKTVVSLKKRLGL